MLDKASKDVQDKKNMKPLTDDQIKELEEYLKNQTLGGESGGDGGGGMD
jgi:ribosomal protein S13